MLLRLFNYFLGHCCNNNIHRKFGSQTFSSFSLFSRYLQHKKPRKLQKNKLLCPFSHHRKDERLHTHKKKNRNFFFVGFSLKTSVTNETWKCNKFMEYEERLNGENKNWVVNWVYNIQIIMWEKKNKEESSFYYYILKY